VLSRLRAAAAELQREMKASVDTCAGDEEQLAVLNDQLKNFK
jgi:hypothetical protein